jgi:RNA polymerase sigma factor (sigma-70 family)
MKPPFQRLIDDHAASVKRFLVASVGPSDAEDCLQDTFVAALVAYPKLSKTSNLRAWLFTIARNKAIDHHRGKKRTVPGDVPDRGTEDARGMDAALIQAIGSLPEKQRTAVALRYVIDLPYKEVALSMGTTPEAARRNVHEGIKTLREVLT